MSSHPAAGGLTRLRGQPPVTWREQARAVSRQENFPVASRLLPRRIRRDLFALYGFARLVDDLGDESEGDREALLDEFEADLVRVFTTGRPRHPLLADLVPTVRAAGLPDGPFRRLIAANRQDQRVRRYPLVADLLAYCELSANPVGELVLLVFGSGGAERLRCSDAVCTALQLVEHLQDVGEDYRRGRVYLPGEDLWRFGVPETDLGAETATPRLRRLVAFEARRAREWLVIGSGLINQSQGYLRAAVTGFIAGGHAALDAMAEVDHDVLAHAVRPAPSRLARRTAGLLVRGG